MNIYEVHLINIHKYPRLVTCQVRMATVTGKQVYLPGVIACLTGTTTLKRNFKPTFHCTLNGTLNYENKILHKQKQNYFLMKDASKYDIYSNFYGKYCTFCLYQMSYRYFQKSNYKQSRFVCAKLYEINSKLQQYYIQYYKL